MGQTEIGFGSHGIARELPEIPFGRSRIENGQMETRLGHSGTSGAKKVRHGGRCPPPHEASLQDANGFYSYQGFHPWLV